MHIVPGAAFSHLGMLCSNIMLSAVQSGGSGTVYQLPLLSALVSTGVMLCQQRAWLLQS
jgi:hypothetical protein